MLVIRPDLLLHRLQVPLLALDVRQLASHFLGVLGGLRGLGVKAELWRVPAGGRQAQCFAGPERDDLVDGQGRKLLGGALRRRLGRGLYQGSLRLAGWGDRTPELEEAVAGGLAREWGEELSRDLDPAWLRRADRLAEK